MRTLIISLFFILFTTFAYAQSEINPFVTGTAVDAYPADASPNYDWKNFDRYITGTAVICNTDSADALTYKVVLQPAFTIATTVDMDGATDKSIAAGICDFIYLQHPYKRVKIFVKNSSAGNNADFAIVGNGRIE